MTYYTSCYTSDKKDYCDKNFFGNLQEVVKDNPIFIVDNSPKDHMYYKRLKMLCPKAEVVYLGVPDKPEESVFQRKVAFSVNLCREHFLTSNCNHMLIVETDVLPPHNTLELFTDDIHLLKETNVRWGAICARYYMGFHDYTLKGTLETNHCLSGCTVYNRKLIRETPFRWDNKALNGFPDAFMSSDATSKGYKLFNNYNINCLHLSLPSGARVSY